MSEEEKPCAEPEVYGPTKPPKRPAAIGRRFNGGVKQFRPNGVPMTRKVSKAERRIRRRASMIVATRPIDGQLAGAAVQRAEVERNTSNSHEVRRLLKKERQFQRARRAEERRQMHLLKMQEAAITPAPSSSTASPSPETSPSKTSES